ncbi:response regulator transcription factor [Myxococcaceae bacterium JPH2]|nr:response regulator transcription factor [Myxococcaceae bacterium JPH2]
MEPHPHLLLVEDDERLAGLIQTFLRGHGFEVRWMADGPSALRALAEAPPACIILDVLLPGLDGLEVCRRAREHFTGFILMLTAQDEDIQEVVALDLGADDYLTKPVRPQVLLSRLRALLRRAARGVPEAASRHVLADATSERASGALRINGVLRTVTRAGASVELTDAEFDLLWMLARRAPDVLSRDDLLAELRGIEHDGLDRSIDMRISKLRRKLGDDVPPHRLIRTVRGRGYFLAPE